MREKSSEKLNELKSKILQDLIVSSSIELTNSISLLVGGFSQTYNGGVETISDGESNNCLGANCNKHCGMYPPDTPVGSNTGCG